MENNNRKKLLVVIDVQNCFVNDFSHDIPIKIRDYLLMNKSSYDFVIFTKFINDAKSQFVKYLNWSGCMKPEEIEIAGPLKEFLTEDNVFEKRTYSIFKSERIAKFIEENSVKDIAFCGLTSDGCVLASAFDAFDMGFEVSVIKELTGTCWGPKEFNDSMIKLIGYKIDPKLLK